MSSTRRVLVVSPRFPPVNAADMHRVRQSLPYMRECGWEPTVLAIDPARCDMPLDPLLALTVPEDVRVVHCGAIDPRLTRPFGLGSLDIRAYAAMFRAGAALLARERFDLVYFSTTAFILMALGPAWQRRFGVPFVLDMQDPWVSDYHDGPGAAEPPGGRLKYGLMQALARRLEAKTVPRAAHVICVSPAYPPMFRARYPQMDDDRFTVLPFGAPEADFDLLQRHLVRQTVFNPRDCLEHWAYVGRAGPDMAFALSAFFRALADARRSDPGRFARLRLHFVGTSYANDTRAVETVKPVAEAAGVGDLVEERPRRIPYFEGLQALLDADALIVPGSDDPSYTASKIYPYALARRPLLTIFHEASSVTRFMRDTRAGVAVTFASTGDDAALRERIGREWFALAALPRASLDDAALAAYTSREMTRRQCEGFEHALGLTPGAMGPGARP